MIPLLSKADTAPDAIGELHGVLFSPSWPGYKPEVKEIPDGKGVADELKRYSHVATKYLDAVPEDQPSEWLLAELVFNQCFDMAQAHNVEFQRKVPGWPDLDRDECCLRMLEYPAGVGGEAHTDFDLFTVNIWRTHSWPVVPVDQHVHMGEIGELVNHGCVATRHRIMPADATQMSLVFFALPSREFILPTGLKVGAWLDERMGRSRA